MKKKSTEVYEKVGKRYKKLGYVFTGFPMDGIWLVSDGTNNMHCLIGLKENIPLFALNYRLHENELCKYLMERMATPFSAQDLSRCCCDFFARLAESKGEPK